MLRKILLVTILGAGALHAQDKVAHITDLPFAQVVEIHHYFSDPENRASSDPRLLQTRYSWQHMSHFYPTATIARDGDVIALPRKIDPAIGKVTFVVGGKTEDVDTHLSTHPVDAFMVISKGAIVHERYNTMYPTDKHNWWSCGKVIGSTMMALLEEEGRVDTKRPVSYYLTQLRGSVWDSVKVEEALDMATGLDATEHDEPLHDSQTNPEQGWYRWAVTIGMYPDLRDRNETWVDVLRGMKRRKPPYEAFEYNSINTFVINRIVEAVTGKPLYRVFSERVWQHIGARSDAYVVITPGEGYPLFYGLMSSTLEDMARFAMIFTPSGAKIDGRPILSRSLVRKLQHPTHPEMYLKGYLGRTKSERFGHEKGLGNHYQWDTVFPDGDMYKSGHGGQGLYVSPSKDVVIVWFGTNDGSGQEETMARAIASHLGDAAKDAR